jgi:beta-galactosidase
VKYTALRELIGSFHPEVLKIPVPDPILAIAIPQFAMARYASLWDHLPAPVASVYPRPFEAAGQNQGLVLYRTTLVGRKNGRLVITSLHDYALVFVDGKYIGTIDRRLGETGIDLPATTNPKPVLDILVEGMGHINFAQEIVDRKGITDRVTLAGMTLMNWQLFLMPLDARSIAALGGKVPAAASANADTRPGQFFRGTFTLAAPADTFLDMTGYKKGVVWVNGHNLGRYWEIGPQQRLYCPAPWLKAGDNDVIVLDLHKTDASPLRGAPSLIGS